MEFGPGFRSKFCLVVGASFLFEETVPTIAVYYAKLLALLLYVMYDFRVFSWDSVGCRLYWRWESESGEQIEKEEDTCCHPDERNEQTEGKDELQMFLQSVIYKWERLASLVANLDLNTNSSIAMLDDNLPQIKDFSDLHKLPNQLHWDLTTQQYKSKQCVNGHNKHGSSNKSQGNGDSQRHGNGGRKSQTVFGSNRNGGLSGDDGDKDDDDERRRREKQRVTSEWMLGGDQMSNEEDESEEDDSLKSMTTKNNPLHMSGSSVNIRLKGKQHKQMSLASSAPSVMPIMRSMPDCQEYLLQQSVARSQPHHGLSRTVSFSQLSPRSRDKRREMKRTAMSESALRAVGSVDSRVMTMELAFKCQDRCGYEEWKACQERGCRDTREQLEHYRCCRLRYLRITVGVEDCRRCTDFVSLIWTHAQKCEQGGKCRVFKCHQLKMRMQAAMAVPYTTAATQPLPLSSSLLATSSDFSSGVPSLQSGNEIHSLPAHKAQSQVGSVKERAQFWPVDAMPAAAQCKTSDHYVMPQLNEETNVSLANIQNAVDVGGRGDFNEELPTGLSISFEEVALSDRTPAVEHLLKLGETDLPSLQIDRGFCNMPPAEVLQSPTCMLSAREETGCVVLWPLNTAILTPVDGRYVAQEHFIESVLLGQGAFADVYLCMDIPSEQLFAVKKPFNPDTLNQRELSTWGSLDHHNFVQLFGAVQHSGKIYLFQEYVEGGSLSSLLLENDVVCPLPEIQALVYTFQVLQGLHYLHAQMKIVHRDIKPENILVKENNVIKIADFGLAIPINEIPFDVERSFHPAGTDCYMPPEVARGEMYYSNRDVWSVGCVLYKLLTGKSPHDHLRHMKSLIFVIGRNENGPDIPPGCCCESVMKFFRDVFVRATGRPSAIQLLTHEAFVRPFHSLTTSPLQSPEPQVTSTTEAMYTCDLVNVMQPQSTDPVEATDPWNALDPAAVMQSQPTGPVQATDALSDESIESNERELKQPNDVEKVDSSRAAVLLGESRSRQELPLVSDVESRSDDVSPATNSVGNLEVSPMLFTSPQLSSDQSEANKIELQAEQLVESFRKELDPIVESPSQSVTSIAPSVSDSTTSVQSVTSTAPSGSGTITPFQSITGKSIRNEVGAAAATTEASNSEENHQQHNQQPTEETACQQKSEMYEEISTEQPANDNKTFGKGKQANWQQVEEKYLGMNEDVHKSNEPSDNQSDELVRAEYFAQNQPRSRESSLSSAFSREDAKSLQEYSQHSISKDGRLYRRTSSRPHSRVYHRSQSCNFSVFSAPHQILQRVSSCDPQQGNQGSGIQRSGAHVSGVQQSHNHLPQHDDGREVFGPRGNDSPSNYTNTTGSFATAPNASEAIEEEVSPAIEESSQIESQTFRRQIGPGPLSPADVREAFTDKGQMDGKGRALESGQQQETGSYCDFSNISNKVLEDLRQLPVGMSQQGRAVVAPEAGTEPTEMAFGRASVVVGASSRSSSSVVSSCATDIEYGRQKLGQHVESNAADRGDSTQRSQKQTVPAIESSHTKTKAVQPDYIQIEVFDSHLPTQAVFNCKLRSPMSAIELAKYLEATVKRKMPNVCSFTLGLVEDKAIQPLDKKHMFTLGMSIKVAIVPVLEGDISFNFWFLDSNGTIQNEPTSPMASVV